MSIHIKYQKRCIHKPVQRVCILFSSVICTCFGLYMKSENKNLVYLKHDGIIYVLSSFLHLDLKSNWNQSFIFLINWIAQTKEIKNVNSYFRKTVNRFTYHTWMRLFLLKRRFFHANDMIIIQSTKCLSENVNLFIFDLRLIGTLSNWIKLQL